MSITIHLEIGHDASLRTKTTPEGFTHDWEVYVKGSNGAEIHYYVEKVVFHLHETFPKPKRVVKEPPYSLRTSGYAGFNLPIEIYLRNNQEPKKIKFNYDLQLQPRGPPIRNVQKEKYVFHSPSEEFRNKLLKGGGVIGSGGAGQETNESKLLDEKIQMTSKPKLSGSDMLKKHKIKPEEPRNTDFLNLFGTPITKTTSKAPDPPKPKEVPKSSKLDKVPDKDKTKTKSPHKDKDKEKLKEKDKSLDNSDKKKEDKKKSKDDKNKDRDRAKEKKREKEREKSPVTRPRSASPKRSPKRPPSPSPQKHSSSKEKEKEQLKDERKDKERKEEKKNKKEKREHKESKHKDRDKEHKEHKNRDIKPSKDSSGSVSKEIEANSAPVNALPPQIPPQKVEKKEKPKELKDESPKLEKIRTEKSEDKQKHKHKKKDKKEKREEKYSSKTEKKFEKPVITMTIPKSEESKEPPPVSSSRDTDKNNLFGSPKSESPTTPNQTESKEKSNNFKDEEVSNDSVKISSRESTPQQRAPSKSPELPPEPVKKPVDFEKKKEDSPKKKEKKEKKKDKKGDRDHEKRRKRKSPVSHTEVEQPPEKITKDEENNNSDDERKVSSTEDANPLPRNEAEDYMGMLRDLQQKIMGLTDNSDLQKVVQLIAETGRYEVSAHTFDFDLCLLDRSTVRQLQEFFATIS